MFTDATRSKTVFAVATLVALLVAGSGCPVSFYVKPDQDYTLPILPPGAVDSSYEVAGVVVSEGDASGFDVLGLVASPSTLSGQAMDTAMKPGALTSGLTKLAQKTGADAITDVRLVSVVSEPGCLFPNLLPIGYARVIVSATAVRKKGSPTAESPPAKTP